MAELRTKSCYDLDNVELRRPDKHACEECVKQGEKWVHLRKCQDCGATLCCDSSPNQHARKHFYKTRHPVIISAEPGEKWAWCFKHTLFTDNFYE